MPPYVFVSSFSSMEHFSLQLEPYMDEEFILRALRLMGEDAISVKVIKNKFTGEPASYGFINFANDPAALMAMHKVSIQLSRLKPQPGQLSPSSLLISSTLFTFLQEPSDLTLIQEYTLLKMKTFSNQSTKSAVF